MTEKLKPCPFCGSRSVYVEQIGSGCYFNVCCCNCLANVPLSGSRETAVEAWNRRPNAKELVVSLNVSDEQVRRMVDDAVSAAIDELLGVADECDAADVDGVTDWAARIRKAVGE